MSILGWQIRLVPPGKYNLWAMFLGILAAAFLVEAAASSDLFLRYRLGSLIVPSPAELIREGPFSMSAQATRHDPLFRFTSPDGKTVYSEPSGGVFYSRKDFDDFIRTHQGQLVAYLLISRKNPLRTIWGVDVDGYVIQSYSRSLFFYNATTRSYRHEFFIFIGLFILFSLSLVRVRRAHAVLLSTEKGGVSNR